MSKNAVIRKAGEGLSVDGASFGIREWSHGSMDGPPLHVHHKDDEAWHVLEGTLRFRLSDRTAEAPAGTTVFVPAGIAHTYGCSGDVRYLIITTPRIFALIEELHTVEDQSPEGVRDVYRKYESDVVE